MQNQAQKVLQCPESLTLWAVLGRFCARRPGAATSSLRSAPAGLEESAEQHGARLIVVGSSSAGVFGHVSLGSVSDHLLHSSPVPVALTPRGHRCKVDSRLERVTAAFGGPGGADDLVLAAAGVVAEVGASLRVASFAVRSRPPYTSAVGRDVERTMIEQWVHEIVRHSPVPVVVVPRGAAAELASKAVRAAS